MSKKRFIVSMVLWIIMALVMFTRAGVQVRSYFTKQYRLDIKPGERLLVVDETHTMVRVYPKEAKIFDTGRLAKKLTGMLTEK